MERMIGNIVKNTLILLMISIGLRSSGQKPDNVATNAAYSPDYNSLFFTFDYSNQTNTFGVVSETVKQPNYSGGIGFFSKHNFDISLQSVFTENADTSFSKTSTEIDFMAGYSFMPNEYFTIYPSYSHMEYNNIASPLLSAFSDIAQLNFYYNKGAYFGGLSSSLLFGNKNMFYLSWQNALGFYFDDILLKKSLLSIQLEIDLSLSDKNYYNKLIYDLWNSEQFLSWVSKEYPLTQFVTELHIETYGLEETKESYYDFIDERDQSIFGPSYGITSVNIILPVYYSAGHFLFNFTTFLVIPAGSTSFYEQNTQLVFNVGIAYNLDF